MRVFVFPVVTLALIAGGFSDEPTEAQMQRAFETVLAAQIRNVLDFVEQQDGPDAVHQIQQAGSDRFAVRTFRKIECSRAAGGYQCSFAVDIDTMNGNLDRRISGRFTPDSGGLTFTEGV